MSQEPDWGAYLAGAMTPEESAEIDALLATDDTARSQLHGYKEFAASLKHAGQAEKIPTERLQQALAEIVRPQRRTPRIAFAVAACLIAAIAWAGFTALTFDPMALATTPTTEQITVQSPEAAMQWVHDKSPIDTPLIDLQNDAQIVGARYGEGWACYDYEVDGEAYFLYMSPKQEAVTKGDPFTLEGRPAYKGKGIGWQSGSLAYYIKGGDDDTREQLARIALAATEN
jgi:hypothetical protein